MSQFIRLDNEVSVLLPEACRMSGAEQRLMERRIAAFVLWELNEFIRLRTGVVNYYGASAMEGNYNDTKKKN